MHGARRGLSQVCPAVALPGPSAPLRRRDVHAGGVGAGMCAPAALAAPSGPGRRLRAHLGGERAPPGRARAGYAGGMGDGDIHIRRATEDDAAALQQLIAAHRHADEEDEKVDRYRERLGSLVTNPAHHIVVAEAGGRLLGYAAAQDYGPAPHRDWSIARMHDLWVSPDARGKGAGTALFEAVREWAEQHTRIRVLEWQSLDVAADFYRRLGLAGEHLGDGDPRKRFELEVHLPSRD